MKKLSKVLCVVLSFMLLVNLTGAEVLAAEITDVKSETGDATTEAGSDNVTKETAGDEEDSSSDEIQSDDSKTVSDDSEDAKNTDAVIDEQNAEDEQKAEDVQKESADQTEKIETQTTEVETLSENPVKVEVNSERTGFTVSWNAITDATEYKVVLGDEREFVTENTSRIFTADDVQVGVNYTVEVFASVNGSEDPTLVGAAVPVVLLAKPEITTTPVVGSITIGWKAVEGADFYLVNNEDKGNVTSYTANGLTSGKTYTYNVKAVAKIKLKEDSEEYTYESEEVSVSATVKYAISGKVSGLTGMDGDKSAILTWDKMSGASSYNIFRFNASKNKWDVVKKDLKTTTYTDVNLKAGMKYQYRVAAVNPAGESGELSDTVVVNINKTPGTKVRTIGYKAVVKSRAPIFSSKKGKKKVKYLKKGTRITTTDYGSGRYEFKLSDGKTYWISKDRLTLTASVWTTKDYSTKTKTDFVNKKGYKSPTKYLIWINQYTQKVMIYTGKKGNWKLIRSCKCATGTHLHYTPRGVFKITYKEKGWFYKTTYEKPIVHFKDANSFHSRIKNYKGGYADATIGKPRSKGCVRLYDKDIVFIYKNCPKGTTVVSH